ncbi:hemagglutinin repeat-containing protein [Comamonas sp. CMM01]|uniref:two-partner secretion domain-containing protein n=1 Tax=Comamonas sp. CMM01 TaxID=2769280 RepID=UPI0017817F56|nr:hemagglutinin repeat-containing protein [Comamonas sp. CMM01]MBD9530411.1 hemagglutinin repeat-containing protein [Comamonas sp. CMM01]
MNNKAYRVIWSEELCTYVAVPEFARACGKRSSSVVLAAASSLAVFFMQSAAAQVSVSSGNTQAYSGLNGVTVVDIATANANGLSHNKYNQFNVDAKGLVLNNNALTSPIQSNLAGQVERNMNLNAAAKVILNEVVMQNRSTLQGYMEVAGTRADVIVANPWGITCSGCGFINTDRAMLTTGTPNIAQDGSISSFRTNQGDILINGRGLNGNSVNILDIVARSVVLDGQVNANDLKLVVGNNEFSYATRVANAVTASGAPTVAYAIDSTILGGAYANKIDIIATEQGVGVRMLGDVAATGSDFTLTAAGKIELQSNISAARNAAITSTASGTDAIHSQGASLSAGQNLILSATAGQVHLSEGALHAGQDLQISAKALADTASAEAKRFASRNQTWQIEDHADINGGQIGAGARLDVTVGSLAVGDKGTSLYSGSDAAAADRSLQLTATQGDLQLGSASLVSPGALSVEATAGEITVGAAGRIHATAQLDLGAGTAIRNQGQILGATQIHVRATDAETLLDNSGTLQASGDLVLGNAGQIVDLNNSGTLLTGASLQIEGGHLSNTGRVQATDATTIRAVSLDNNAPSAAWLLSTESGQAGSIHLSEGLNNQGALQSAGGLSVVADGAIHNSGNLSVADDAAYALTLTGNSLHNSGNIVGSGTTTLTGTATSGAAITNSGQIHTTGEQLSLVTGGGAIENTGSGKILADQALTLSNAAANAELTNAGLIQSLGAMALGQAGHTFNLHNSGADSTVLSNSTLAISGGSITNSGTLQAKNGSTITAASLVNNAGSALTTSTAAGADGSITLDGDFTNAGTVQSAGGLNVSAADHTITNSGTLLSAGAADSLQLTGAQLNNSGAIKSANTATLTATQASGNSIDNSGTLYSVGALTLNTGASLNNAASGKILSDSAISLATAAASANLSNAGRIQSGGAMVLGAADHRFNLNNSNANSVILAGSTLTSHGGSLTNLGTVQATTGATVTATSFTNSGSDAAFIASTVDGGNGTLTLSGAFDNEGTLQSAGGLTVAASGQTLDNSGVIYASGTSGSLSLSGSQLSNTSTGIIQGNGSVAIDTTLASGNGLDNAGTVYSKGALNVTAADDIANSGQLLADGNLTLATGSALADLANSGRIQSGAAMVLGAADHRFNLNNSNANSVILAGSTLTSHGGSLTNLGTVQATTGATVTATSFTNSGANSAFIVSTVDGGDGTLTLGGNLDNSGKLQSAGGLTVNAGSNGITNRSGALISATGGSDTLSLTASTISNSGTIQGGGATSLSGTSTSATGLTNASGATLYSVGTLNIQSGRDIDNAGSIIGSGTVQLKTSSTVSGTGTVSNSGTLQSGGNMSLMRDTSGAMDMTLANAATGVIRAGGWMYYYGNSINNQGAMQAATGMNLESTGTLVNGSASNSSALILAATGTAQSGYQQIKATSLDNYGAIHSNDNVTLLSTGSGGITNRNTGGLSSLQTLSLDTSGADNINNHGALYGGAGLKLTAAARTIYNREGATIDSNGTLTTSSANFYNFATVRVADAGITTSTYFYNGPENMPTKYVDTGNVIAKSGISSYYNWQESNCIYCNEQWLNQQFITYREVQSGSLPTVTPQILASGTLTVNYGAQGVNRVGILSGNVVNLSGTNFANEAFYLDQVVYVRRQSHYETDCVTCDKKHYYASASTEADWARMDPSSPSYDPGYYRNFHNPDLRSDEQAMDASLTKESSRSLYQTVASAYVYATTLNVTGGSVTNSGSPRSVTTTSSSQSGSSAANGGLANGASGSSAATHNGTSGASGSSATTHNGTSGSNGSSAATAGGTSGAAGVGSASSSTSGTSGTSATNTNGTAGANAASSDSAGPVSGTTTKTVVAADVLSKTPSIALGGVTINFPTNPNGYFVPTKNPESAYLIETNPRFSVGTASVGSDYLEKRLGYNPDVNIKRLGDANYEAELIRQQLINETGRNLLAGNSNEAAQIQSFMDHAATQATALGLEYGKPLTASQVAGLTSDIVWMEVIDVGGINVLAPRVYLSAASKAMITGGAVMAADNTTMNVSSLTNTGGTISGSNSLSITSQGDITNTSGTLSGGNVSLTSTGGDIINRTLVEVHGDSAAMATTIGKTGVISATGNLGVTAVSGNISVQGAGVSAGGNATLKAGQAITFDTIVEKASSTTAGSSSSGFLESASNTTTTATTRNIGSTVTVGGTLGLSSGKDTTIAGSTVSAGALAVDAGGDFNVLARQDTSTTHSVSTASGVGVGGGVYGMETKTTDSFKSTSAGSAIDVTGNATITSAGTTTLQGSALNVGGDANITSKQGIQVVDAVNIDRTKTVTETTTFLKLTDSSDTKTETEAKAGAAQQKAKASASAGAEASNESSLRLMEASTTTETKSETTSAGSSLNVGGNLTAKTDGTLTIQGSKVSAGGDVALEAKSIDVLAGRNEKVETSDTTRTSIGFYSESNASAEAEAQASAKARGLAANAGASAEASAGASSTLTVGAKHEQESSSERTVTNTSSTIQSGGNMSITAKGDATFVGATVESGGNLDVSAKSITNKAAQDTQEKTTSSSSHLAGVYIGTAAEANVAAEANLSASTGVVVGGGAGDKDKSDSKGSTSTAAGSKATASTAKTGSDDKTAAAKDSGGLLDETGLKADASASASASASAEVTAGVRYQYKQESETEGSVTQVTNSFTAKGSITRTATDTITDQGTQMEAGKNINQTARVINDEAVSDSTYSSKDAQSHDARIGAYAGASASASASVEGKASVTGKVESEKPEVEAGASAGLGVKASYTGSISSESESSTTAVTSRYKAGGDISSTSQEKTTLSGTAIEAGGNVSLGAGSLDYNAAKDTKTSSKNEHDIAGQATVRVIGTAGADVGLSYDGSIESESATTARAGSIKSGGDTRITTKGDANFTGTDIASGGKTAVNAGGDVNFNAAQSTTDSASHEIGVSVNVSSSKKSDSIGAEANYDMSIGSSNTAKGSSITSGGGVEISSGKSVTLEGTGIESKGDVSISARDKVDLKAAVSSETNVGLGIGVAVEAKTKKEGAAPSSADSKSDNKTGTDSTKKAEPAKQEQTTKAAEAGKTAEDGAEEDKNKKKAETGVGVDFYSGTESTSTSISSTGKINIKAGTVVNQEAKLEGAEGTSVAGKQVQKSAVNGSISLGVNAGVSTGD